MIRLICLLLLSVFVVNTISAQQITVHGYLKDSITHFPIYNGTITNVNSGKKIATDAKGYFRIQAAPNDFFYILARSYNYDTLTYSFLYTDTITVYLTPSANLLPSVTVTAQYSRYQYDSIERRSAFEAGMGKPMTTLSSPNSGGFGVALNLDKFFKKKYKNRKRSEDLFDSLEESAYVDHRFSPHLVAQYTGFKADTLQAFITQNTPTYSWLRQHPSNEDVLYYINDKLKDLKAAKAK
ncbi:MAG TPA: hypothetical protein VF610_10450 [Segetibacter sp.]|jgi:hypothetical protein